MTTRRTAQQKAALVSQHLDNGVPLTRLADGTGVSLRTIRRWAAVYRAEQSVSALERRERSDHGQRRFAAELVGAVEGLALRQPAPTIAFIHRRIADIARDRGLSAPSYTTVRSIVAGLDPGLRELASGGEAAYRDRFELVYRRAAARPNEQWQADHTLLDIAVLDEKGQPGRPWLTVVLDDHSRAVAGYALTLRAPTAEHTALAFHHAVARKRTPAWPVMGLPDMLYSDHGSDFISARLERVCLDTHVRLIHSAIGVPQGRGKIERFYRTVTTELLPHLPGHIPHGTRGVAITPASLTLKQLDAVVERFIVDVYLQRTHSETGQPPSQRWLGDGWIPRLPGHPEDLDLLLLTAAAGRKVQRDGIQFNTTRYVSPVLAAYVGEQVTVRYDPRDAAEIRVYHDDRYVCRAIAPELAGETISFEQLRAARTTRRRELKRLLRDRRSLADALPADERYAIPVSVASPVAAPDAAPPQPQRSGHSLRTYAADAD